LIELLGRSLKKTINFTVSIHQNAEFSIRVIKNFPEAIPSDPRSGRGDLLPHPTPSPAFGRARGALLLGPKPRSPSTFQQCSSGCVPASDKPQMKLRWMYT